MSVVAGVDFGTLSVRISIFDKERGKLGSATADYPLHRSASDPNLATQSHEDQMGALVRAMHEALQVSGVDGNDIASIASFPSATTTSNATIALKEKQPRSPAPLTPIATVRDLKASTGAAASTTPSGDGRSSSTGSATTRRAVANS